MKLSVTPSSTNHEEPHISYPSGKSIFSHVIHSAPTCIKESKHPVSLKLVPWTSLTSLRKEFVPIAVVDSIINGVTVYKWGYGKELLSIIWGPLLQVAKSRFHRKPAQQMAYSIGMIKLIWLGPLLY